MSNRPTREQLTREADELRAAAALADRTGQRDAATMLRQRAADLTARVTS
jgi:hypothetical protein